MPEPGPSPKSLAAAREAIQKNPALAQGRAPDEVERKLAEYHADLGDSRFRLIYGLRPPKGRPELIEIELITGRITPEEYAERCLAEIAKPVDEVLIQELCDALEEQVVAYGKFLTAIHAFAKQQRHREPVDETALEPYLEVMEDKLPIFKEHLAKIGPFLDEARLEKHLGIARAGDHQGANTLLLISRVFKHASAAWNSSQKIAERSHNDPRYAYAAEAWALFYRAHLPSLPLANELLTLLYQERSAATMVLRSRQQSPPAQPDGPRHLNVSVETCTITTPTVQVTAADSRSPSRPSAPASRLTIARWSDLALGVDEHHKAYAISPPPTEGAVVLKRAAHSIRLAGKRWTAFFNLILSSPDGRSVATEDLRRELELACGRSSQRRGRPTVKRSRAQGDRLTERVEQADRVFQERLADLRRDLREQVQGPKPGQGSSPLLEDDGKTVQLGFVVRALVQDENRHWRFGSPPV